MLDVRVVTGGATPSEVGAAVVDILSGNDVFFLATTGGIGEPNGNMAFFAFDDDLSMYFVSDRSTRHSANLVRDQRAAAAVHLPPPAFGEGLRGAQLRGSAGEVPLSDAAHALDTYRRRFPDFAQDAATRDEYLHAAGPTVLYRISVAEVTVLDEPRFGRRNYITASIVR